MPVHVLRVASTITRYTEVLSAGSTCTDRGDPLLVERELPSCVSLFANNVARSETKQTLIASRTRLLVMADTDVTQPTLNAETDTIIDDGEEAESKAWHAPFIA